jgi:hypothetical protein
MLAGSNCVAGFTACLCVGFRVGFFADIHPPENENGDSLRHRRFSTGFLGKGETMSVAPRLVVPLQVRQLFL